MKKTLLADVGGTKTLMAIAEGDFLSRVETFSSQKFSSLEEIIHQFLGKERGFDRACLGVAGPVIGNLSSITNLPWVVNAKKLSWEFGIDRVFLLNDLEATGFAIGCVDVCTLYKGEEGEGRFGIISPGTGLGESIVIPFETKRIVIPSEGGHVDFAPRNEKEIALFRYLKEKHGHVSYERILSGGGLLELYAFAGGRGKKEAKEITKDASVAGSLEEEVVSWFFEILGAECGNLALKGATLGGIFIGGGMVIHMLPLLLRGESFLKGFLDKGRFSPFVKKIPVHILLDPNAVLYGAREFLKN